MPNDYLTTKELADLLRIKERKVYHLAASGSIPCSKAMGKLLFPRKAVEDWLAARSFGPEPSAGPALPRVFLGSHDPLLEWALRESRSGIAIYVDGSTDGLTRFKQREGLATGLHLYDPGCDDWNVPAVAESCAGMAVVLVEWARRQRGLIIASGLKTSIRKVADLAGHTLAARQAESGSQALFLHLAEQAGLSTGDLSMTGPARTEADAALMVAEGKAHAAFGLAALASQYRLPFVPIIEERFDLLVDRFAWFEPPMQTFLDFCHSKQLRDRAAELAGYSLTDLGRVRLNMV